MKIQLSMFVFYVQTKLCFVVNVLLQQLVNLVLEILI